MPTVHDQPAPTIYHVPQLPPQEDAAKYIADLFAHGGDNTTVLLEQGASYNLFSMIALSGHHQELATEGYPTDNVLKARLFTRGKDEAGAVRGVNKRYQAVRNVAIHGCRTDYGWLPGGAALVSLGDWDAVQPAVEDCVLSDPRGWSCLHLVDGAQGARALNNLIGPAGQPPPHGPWADGLSVACRNGVVANNTIIDATDGAIVLFGAPGTLVTCNTIIARTRNLLGGINQVDPALFKGDYTGTRVINNRIVSEGAFIHLAMGIGSTTWGDAHDMQVYGGSVLGNIIGPGRFGYGIAAAGCRDYTILQNRIAPNSTFSGDMEAIPRVSPPTPFLRIDDGWAEGTFQDGFVEGPVRYLIGVKDGLSRSLEYHSGAIQMRSGSVIDLQSLRFELKHGGSLIVSDRHTGQELWSSAENAVLAPNTSGPSPELILSRQTGRLQIVQGNSVLWDPSIYLERCGYTTTTNDPTLVISDNVPYLQVRDGGSTLYTSQPWWKHFDLYSGDFIAIPTSRHNPTESTVPPPIPHEHRPTSLREALSDLGLSDRQSTGAARRPSNPSTKTVFLHLDPATSQLVLHTSLKPSHVDEQSVIWRSPNWKTPASDPSDRSKATLQSDGNFVIYAGKVGAVWATGSNGSGNKGDSIRVVTDGVNGSTARLQICSGSHVVWSSS